MTRFSATTRLSGPIKFLQCRCRRALFPQNNKRLSWMYARAACSLRMDFAASLKMSADTRDIIAAALASATALITKELFGAGYWGLLFSPTWGFRATARQRRAFLSGWE